MNLIACVDSNWAIGKDNKLLIKIPADMKHFKSKTINKVVIMGRKTLQSFPNGPLKDRVNIVLSANKTDFMLNEVYVSSIDECLELIKHYDTNDIFIIGGASIYKQFEPYCDTAYITKVDKEFEADTYFPNLDEISGWKVQESSEEFDFEGIKYRFITYKR